jgi:hypothetical protein
MRNPWSSASNVNHSLTKPPSGGTAASVSEATPTPAALSGSWRASPPRGVDRPAPGRLLDAIDPDQRQRLGQVGSTYLQRCGQQAGGGQVAIVGSLAQQRDAQAQQHDAGVLDRGVAQEPPQLILGDGVGDPRDGGDRTENQGRVAAPGREWAENREHEPPQSVEAGGESHRQPRSAQPGRGAIPRRQTALHGQHPDLGAEADQE